MRHRNLDSDPGYTPMAIDNVINRGTVKDWADMIAAAKADPQICGDIAALCREVYERLDEEADWRLYGFWQQWSAGNESVLDLVDWDNPTPDEVYPFPYDPGVGPVEHPRVMRKRINTHQKRR